MKEKEIKKSDYEEEIYLSKNKLFLLVRELRELRKMMKEHKLSNVEITKRHDYKILEETFNKILETNGIEKFINNVLAEKRKYVILTEIEGEE